MTGISIRNVRAGGSNLTVLFQRAWQNGMSGRPQISVSRNNQWNGAGNGS